MKNLIFFCLIFTLASCRSEIFFITYPEDGSKIISASNETFLEKCDVNGNITIVIHGWTESSTTEWTTNLIANFTAARAGCVIFMDYNVHSKLAYALLCRKFEMIHKTLTEKLIELENLGYDPANFFLFGFSFGAHVAFEGAFNYGPRKVARIDVCDPAGPGFTIASKIHAMEAAKDVQCIHTSSDKGTRLRYCPKNVLLGHCGLLQDAATLPPKMSHGLCPYMYTSMFEHDFKFVTKADVKAATRRTCTVPKGKIEVDISTLTENAVAGFRMNMSFPDGQYYALTSKNYPYNVA